MFATLVSVALFSGLAIKGARADFTVDTPALVQVSFSKPGWQPDASSNPPPAFYSANLPLLLGLTRALARTTSLSSPAMMSVVKNCTCTVLIPRSLH